MIGVGVAVGDAELQAASVSAIGTRSAATMARRSVRRRAPM